VAGPPRASRPERVADDARTTSAWRERSTPGVAGAPSSSWATSTPTAVAAVRSKSADTAEEQHREQDQQGVLVQHEHDPAPAHRPRSLRVVGVPPGVIVLRALFVQGLGLARPLLEQEHREHDVRAHLQELALPVLEGRLGEVPARQEAPERHGRLAVLQRVRHGHPPPGEHHADEAHDEDGDVREEQAVPSHAPPPTRSVVQAEGHRVLRSSRRRHPRPGATNAFAGAPDRSRWFRQRLRA